MMRRKRSAGGRSKRKPREGGKEDRVLESRMPTKTISEGSSSLTFGNVQFIVP